VLASFGAQWYTEGRVTRSGKPNVESVHDPFRRTRKGVRASIISIRSHAFAMRTDHCIYAMSSFVVSLLTNNCSSARVLKGVMADREEYLVVIF
jgi:hypothetical protein